MNISCEIIKDLLPLYHDGVCSSESRSFVETHLDNCENCKAELQTMNTILFDNNTEKNMKEAEAVQHLSIKWKKGMLLSLLKGVFSTIITLVIILLILYIFVDIRHM